MKEHEHIAFSRKPENKQDIRAGHSGEKKSVSVHHKIGLSPEKYDEFVKHPLRDHEFLKGKETAKAKHGAERGAHEVSAPDRPKLYVDPQGYSYGRYVGIKEHEHPYWNKK